MREYLSGVQLIQVAKDEPIDASLYQASGTDTQGDVWLFSSEDRERATAALADFAGYKDVKLSEKPDSSVSERVLWGG